MRARMMSHRLRTFSGHLSTFARRETETKRGGEESYAPDPLPHRRPKIFVYVLELLAFNLHTYTRATRHLLGTTIW